MTTQTVTMTTPIFWMFTLAPGELPLPLQENDNEADCNFYENEEEVARELACPTPAILLDQPLLDVSPDEFESVFQWFLA